MPAPPWTKPPSAYHHGNLKEALVAVSVEIIAGEGLDALTLRRAARDAGVSHTAPKHHFGDLRGLLAAIAEDGYARLRSYMQPPEDQPIECLQHLGVGYVRFAVANPGHFRAMFHHSLGDKTDFPTLRDAAARTFGIVVDTIELCQRAGVVRAGDARHLAMLAWSTVHGFASLAVDDQLRGNGFDEDPTELAERMTSEMWQGLRA